MKNQFEAHRYVSPTKMVHGIHILDQLPLEIAALSIKKPLVVTDWGIRGSGILDRVLQPVQAASVPYAVFDGVEGEPTTGTVAAGSEAYRRHRCDGILAVGGGSSMDAAKAVGAEIAHGEAVLHYECAEGKKPLTKRIPPLIAIPTTAGTGSEMTLWAVITDEERHYKFNVGGPELAAHVAFIDPALHVSMPAAVTASTGMDAICHAIECFTCAYAQPVTDTFALSALEYGGKYLRRAVANGQDLEARYGMALAAMLAGMTYGTDSAGAVHALTQTLGGIYPIPHGKAVAATLVPVMEYNWLGEPEKYGRIAAALGADTRGCTERAGALAAIEAVRNLAADIGIANLAQLGVKAEDVPRLAQAAYDDPQTIGNPRDLTVEAYEAIYHRALSIVH